MIRVCGEVMGNVVRMGWMSRVVGEGGYQRIFMDIEFTAEPFVFYSMNLSFP